MLNKIAKIANFNEQIAENKDRLAKYERTREACHVLFNGVRDGGKEQANETKSGGISTVQSI